MSEPTVIASVDPGLAHVGWAVGARYGAKLDLIESGYIETEPSEDLDLRLRTIWVGLAKPFKAYRPAVVGVENQSPASVGKRVMQLKAARSGEKAGGWNASNDQVFEVVGIAKAVAWSFGARVVLFTPERAKIAACGPGKGRATKSEVINAIRRCYFPGIEISTGRPLVEHEADAIAGFIHVEREVFLQSKMRRRRA